MNYNRYFIHIKFLRGILCQIYFNFVVNIMKIMFVFSFFNMDGTYTFLIIFDNCVLLVMIIMNLFYNKFLKLIGGQMFNMAYLNT